MWVKKASYIALVDKAARAETRADWLRTRVNQLEHEVGALRLKLTGEPQVVPMYHKEATPAPEEPGETSFEDMGDELARKYGVDWDDAGRVVHKTSGE